MSGFTDRLDSSVPTIAATVSQELDDAAIGRVTTVAGVVEYRADLFVSQDPAYLVDQAQRLVAAPLLVTPRLKREGGRWEEDGMSRLRVVERLLTEVEGVAAVDVELDSPILNDVVATAHELGVKVVGSSHNFGRTPTDSTFEGKFVKATLAGVDYVKFATKLRTDQEFLRLMAFTDRHHQEVITVGMGERLGPASRLLLPFLGSCMTYAYFGARPVASGQLECMDMHQRFMGLSADYAAQFTAGYNGTVEPR